MIEITNFGKHYGDFVAVANLNLKIPAGEMFGFIGPNGAGKSTTIRFLATLLQATHGEATVNGHSVTRDPIAVRRSIGYMPDNFGVYDGMKVWEFLDFFAVAYQVPAARRKEVLSDVLELLDLTHKRDDYVNGLSRGMKQRLCLAKTLVHDPPVLILDEPASGLDPRARLEVKALLKELRKMGKTILISSHILTELADCCTSIGIIERGQLLLHGPIDKVYRQINKNRHIEVRFTGSPEAGIGLIQSDPNVKRVDVNARTCVFEMVGQDADVQRLISQIETRETLTVDRQKLELGDLGQIENSGVAARTIPGGPGARRQIDREHDLLARAKRPLADAQLTQAVALPRQNGKGARADLGVERTLIPGGNFVESFGAIRHHAHEHIDAAGGAFRVRRAVQIAGQLQAFLQRHEIDAASFQHGPFGQIERMHEGIGGEARFHLDALAGQEAGADAIGDRPQPQIEARRLDLVGIEGRRGQDRALGRQLLDCFVW